MENKTRSEVRRIKGDNLWRVLQSNKFQRMLQEGGKDGEKNDSRYVLILRGFLSYWLQKKYSTLGVCEERPDTIADDFMEAYDLQM